jgi:hypothetical protein
MLWYAYLSEWCCRLIEFRDGAQPVSALRVSVGHSERLSLRGCEI